MTSTFPSIYFGAMLIGSSPESRQTTLEEAQQMIDVLKAHNVFEIDTARLYGDGSSEVYLAKIKAEEQGFKISTKVHPLASLPESPLHELGKNNNNYTHQAKDVRQACQASLKALNTKKVDIYYLHRPDPKTPYQGTLAAIDEEYRAGSFERFGISNYSLEDVEKILEICQEHGYVKPTVYQGMYNAITRGIEKDLLPFLRKNGISFVAYSPASGGFFNIKDPEEAVESNKRFDQGSVVGKLYRSAFWNEKFFNALKKLRPVAEKNGIEMIEMALRWCRFHSFLSGEAGDAILLGSSSPSQLDQNLKDLEKGPLPEELVDALEEVWDVLKKDTPGVWPPSRAQQVN